MDRHIAGRDAAESVTTLPAWTSGDLLKEVYAEDTQKRWYGGPDGWKLYGGISGSSEASSYQDLLNSSKYLNCSFDGFEVEELVDTGNSTMDYDSTNNRYDFTNGEVLQSWNLYDPTLSTNVTQCMVTIEVSGSGSVTLEATADGTNWESITNNTIHTFTNTGTTLKIKATAVGTGFVNSWGVLYNPDTGTTYGASVRKYLPIYYEGACVDEDIVLDGMYFDNSVAIDRITLFVQTAPTGANLTVDLLKDGSEQSSIATLTAASTYEKTTLSSIIYYATTERFGLKIKQIGSGTAGASLTVIVHYYDT